MDERKDEAGTAAGAEGRRKSFFSRAAAAMERFRHVVVRSSQIGKIKLDSTFLRRERDELLRELGAGVYALAREGAIQLPDSFVPTLERIDRLSEGIAEQERELAEVEAEGPPAWAEAKAPTAPEANGGGGGAVEGGGAERREAAAGEG